MKKNNEKENPDHKKYIVRLNRIKGQVEGISKMILDRRYCPEILIQLKAIRSAIKSLECKILKAHIESCVLNAFESNSRIEKEKKIKELTDLFVKTD